MAAYPSDGQAPWSTQLKAYIDGAAGGISLGASNGSDDTSSINSILSANAGKLIQGAPGASYLISAPLVIKAGTTLDMTGCTVTLKASSNCNMINNTAVSTVQRSVSDAAITSGTTTLTSASASFSSADVGRSVVITGAMAANGGTLGPLCVQITVFTNSTTVTVSAPATATVSGAAMSIYNRDTDIIVRGGIWDRGANGGSGVAQHSIRFRRVDRLTVENIRFTSTSGKYAMSIGSCTRFWIDAISLNAASDGVHIEGDCQYGVINRIDGKDGDDFVALTSRSAPTYTVYEDVAGDISDIIIDTLTMQGGLAPVKLLGGSGTVIKTIKIHNIVTEAGGTVSIGAEDPTLYVGDIRDITIDDLSTTSTVAINIVSNVTDLTVVNVKHVTAVNSPVVVQVTANSTVSNLVIDGVDSRATGTGGGIVKLAASTSTIGRLKLANVYYPTPGTSSYVLLGSSGGTVTVATIDKGTIINGGGFVSMPSGTLTNLRIDNCELTSSSWLCDLGTATSVYVTGTTTVSPGSGLFNIRATGSVIVRGEGNNLAGNQSITAGGIFTSYSSDPAYTATAGGVPTVAAQAGAGTGATVSVVGNDRSGTITVNTGTGTAAGNQVQLTFTRNFGSSVRHVLITPLTSVGAAGNPYVTGKTGTVFLIGAQTALTASTSGITFDYLVIA